MTQTTIHTADITAWLRGNQWLVQNGYMPKAHAVIGDPPYALIAQAKRWGNATNSDSSSPIYQRHARGFMGQKWDGWNTLQDYQAWVTEWATLLLDFVHPGAVLALFGGTRTYHRLACGLEEAGWEVFDSMVWMYGSGFPKGHRQSRDFQIERRGWTGPAISNNAMLTLPMPVRLENLKLERRWDGWNVSLKPSFEPLVLARAPRDGRTYAQLAREFGTAALNVDGGRIPSTGDVIRSSHNVTIGGNGIYQGGRAYETGSIDGRRWPANFALVHSPDCGAACAPGCPVAALGEQSGESVGSGSGVFLERKRKGFMLSGSENNISAANAPDTYGDTGTVARFFYTAKASAFEREAGLPYGERSIHPTMKPIQLIEWLATLLLPPAGIGERRLLVPFAGSGSEMIGAQLARWDVITGIEQSAEYAAIAEARLAWWSQFTSYDDAKERYDSEQRGAAEDAALEDAGQLRLFELAS